MGGFRFVKVGWVLATQTPKSAFFFEKFYRGHDPPHPRRSLYTPPVETQAPSAPERWTRCAGLHPIPDRPRWADQDGAERWRTWGASDRARPNGQKYCKQKYSFFMCKPLDKSNKIVYNIYSKQTYLHHHKTGGQKP